MNKEAKVGALVIIFTVVTLLFAFWIRGNPFQKTKTLNVLFENVHGVSAGSIVEYAGLECGKVKDFTVTPRGVLTRIVLTNSEVKIYENDRFLIAPSSTIASEYQIFIVPGTNPSREVSDKATLIGQSPPGIQDFLFKAEETLEQIDSILTGINKSIQDLSPLFEKVGGIAKDGTIDEITRNVTESTRALSEISVTTNGLIQRNNPKIQAAIDSFSSSSNQLNEKLKAVNSAEVQQAVTSLRNASRNIEAITGAVEPETVRKDLKTFSDAAAQVKQISEKLQSPNPNEDVPTLVKNTMQRADRISAALESSLAGKTLFRGLFSKVNIRQTTTQKKQIGGKSLIDGNKTETVTTVEKEVEIPAETEKELKSETK